MTIQKIYEGTKKLVLNKMGNINTCKITHRKSGEEYFFSRGTDGYTLYHGCDLVIGDCSLDQCVAVLVGLTAA